MKTICQYCNIQTKDDHMNDGRISHGLCENCARLDSLLMDLEDLKDDRDFLNFVKRDPSNILLERTFQTLNDFLTTIHRISKRKNTCR